MTLLNSVNAATKAAPLFQGEDASKTSSPQGNAGGADSIKSVELTAEQLQAKATKLAEKLAAKQEQLAKLPEAKYSFTFEKGDLGAHDGWRDVFKVVDDVVVAANTSYEVQDGKVIKNGAWLAKNEEAQAACDAAIQFAATKVEDLRAADKTRLESEIAKTQEKLNTVNEKIGSWLQTILFPITFVYGIIKSTVSFIGNFLYNLVTFNWGSSEEAADTTETSKPA